MRIVNVSSRKGRFILALHCNVFERIWTLQSVIYYQSTIFGGAGGKVRNPYNVRVLTYPMIYGRDTNPGPSGQLILKDVYILHMKDFNHFE